MNKDNSILLNDQGGYLVPGITKADIDFINKGERQYGSEDNNIVWPDKERFKSIRPVSNETGFLTINGDTFSITRIA